MRTELVDVHQAADKLRGVVWANEPVSTLEGSLVALSQILVAFLMPDFFGGGLLVVALDVILIGMYLLLTYEAGREPDRRSAPRRAATRLWNRSWKVWENFRR